MCCHIVVVILSPSHRRRLCDYNAVSGVRDYLLITVGFWQVRAVPDHTRCCAWVLLSAHTVGCISNLCGNPVEKFGERTVTTYHARSSADSPCLSLDMLYYIAFHDRTIRIWHVTPCVIVTVHETGSIPIVIEWLLQKEEPGVDLKINPLLHMVTER